MSRHKVLIVDDHKVVAEGLVRLLSAHHEVVATLHDGHLVPETVARLRPDLILLDLSMPDVTGLEVLRRLGEHRLAPRTIVLTMHADANLAVEALRAGASGFMLKESSGEELLMAIDVVLRGDTYLVSGLTKEIVTLMVGAAPPERVELSIQQREVLRLIVRGQRTKEIAARLATSTRTIESIKYKIMEVLKVHSTAELVRYAVEHRLVRF